MLQTLDFSRLPFKFAELDHRWMVFCTIHFHNGQPLCGESTKNIFCCAAPFSANPRSRFYWESIPPHDHDDGYIYIYITYIYIYMYG